jgi:DNA-directed RNA polymerase specialized sigma54-like protein
MAQNRTESIIKLLQYKTEDMDNELWLKQDSNPLLLWLKYVLVTKIQKYSDPYCSLLIKIFQLSFKAVSKSA